MITEPVLGDEMNFTVRFGKLVVIVPPPRLGSRAEGSMAGTQVEL